MNTPRLFPTTVTLGLMALASLTQTLSAAVTWDTVPLGGGGYVTGLAANSNGSAIYCRTDVGGVFRWAPAADGNNGSWISLSDNQVPFGVEGAGSVMNVESLATDPNNLNRLYTGAADAVWGSDDQGATWYVVPGSPVINTEGNINLRWCGERLAVDPNTSDVLWYGSRENGLQKGVKQANNTWIWSVIPATDVPWGQVPVANPPNAKGGVIFVACDKNNSGTTIVYAGVYDSVDTSATTTGGVYRSTDLGGTWTKLSVADDLSRPRRAQVAPDGTLYVTAGTSGVFKVARTASTLTKITTLPTTINYNAVAVDPNNSQIVYVSDNSSTAKNVYRTANAGGNWTNQYNVTQTRQEPDGTPSVTGYWFGNTAAMMVNPANSNELWLSDFFGVSRTRNAQDLGLSPGSTWYTLQKNQEETVVFALKNAPTGPKLMAGVADVGGFRYTDITVRPTGAGGNVFTNPSGPNNTSIDFSEANPNIWARTTVGPNGYGGTGAASLDGGVSWASFGQLAQRYITNSPAAGWETFDIVPYLKRIKADNPNAVVTLVIHSGCWAMPSSQLRFSSKEGANAPQLLVNGTTTLTTTADVTVKSGAPTTNYASDVELVGAAYYGELNRWIYLKFDLSTAPANITSASLRLYRLAGTDTYNYATSVYMEDVTSWTENTLTWNTRPLFNGRANTYVSTIPTALGTSTSGGGGRVAVSATDPHSLVWIPVGQGTPSHYSKNLGVTWTASTGGPGSQITGLYTDGNNCGMTAQPLASDRVNGSFYLAAFASWNSATSNTQHVIYRSTNGGQTWTVAGTINNGSGNKRTPQLVAAPVANDLWLCDDSDYYANRQGAGMWRSIDGGGNWVKFSGVGRVTSVSFGKANDGSPHPYAVYIYGYVGASPGVLGVYRSDNLGATWTKLLDPTIAETPSLGGDRQNANSVFLGTSGRGIFHYNNGVIPEIIMDNTASTGITTSGTWTASSYTPGYYGTNYLHDGNSGKGGTAIRYTPTLTVPGTYTVYARWTADANRASNVPVDVVSTSGTSTVYVNMQANGGAWVALGTYTFAAGATGSVRVYNTGTTGYVIADAVRFVKQ
ncbi:MAG: carbohydrate-binding protein [Rariglobus sp.]|nr:carbohydrate-binding protein [Rariglobus sp.]